MSDPHAADLRAIERAVALYSHVIDNREWDRLGDVYCDDALLDLSAFGLPARRGLAEIAEFLVADAPDAMLAGNVVIDLDEGADSASGRVRYLVIRGGTVRAGTYDDTYVRRPTGWRIATRRPRPLTAR